MTDKMNPEVKELWLGDLVDNPDKQGFHCLRDVLNRGCLLGRLCHLYPHPKWDYDFENDLYTFYGQKLFLPDVVVEWAGLNSPNPTIVLPYDDPIQKQLPPEVINDAVKSHIVYFNKEGMVTPLSWLNDRRFTFEQLAELISKYL